LGFIRQAEFNQEKKGLLGKKTIFSIKEINVNQGFSPQR
jgi:hypothetical protein